MFARVLNCRSLLDMLIVVAVLLFLTGPMLADDKAKRDRDAAAALALQLALDSPAVRESAPPPKSARDKAAVDAMDAVITGAMNTLKVEFFKVRAAGWHVHECPQCRAQWSHSDAAYGRLNEHRCPAPGCTGVSWTPLETGVRILEKSVPKAAKSEPADPFFITADVDAADEEELIDYAPPCPDGNCPTYSRSVTRTYIPGPVTRTVVPATVTVVRAAPAMVSRSVSVTRSRQPVRQFASDVRAVCRRLLLRR